MDSLLLLVGLRVANALLVRTFFQPDEFFQALEPAWQLAFGPHSGAWTTWEWEHALRSSLHPLLFAAVYRAAAAAAAALALSPAARDALLLAAPKAVQGLVAGVGDFYALRLAQTVYPGPERRWVLALTLLSPWQWFCSTRTLSNSLETTLTVAALSFWPWRSEVVDVPRLRKSLVLAALACILRPTNAVVWLCLASFLAYSSVKAGSRSLSLLVRESLLCGSAVLAASLLADRAYYGFWTLPALNFLYFNLVQSLAVFYGRNPWHYYLSQGYPLLLTTALPFALLGLYQSLSPPSWASRSLAPTIKRQLAVVCIAMPAVLSLVPHKEVRFIYPLLPCLHILAASPLARFFSPAVVRSPTPFTHSPRRLLLLFLILVNVVIAAYTTLIHGSGVIDVLSYLRAQQRASPAPRTLSVGFLMPCHSTPWRSHLISPDIRAWALSCDPPVNLAPAEKEVYLDEADLFYQNPARFLSTHLSHSPASAKHEWPDYLVFFAALEPVLRSSVRSSSYAECYRTFNSAWHDDPRRRGDVVVWCRDAAVQREWRAKSKRARDAESSQQRHFDRMMDVLVRERDATPKHTPFWSRLSPFRQEKKKSVFSWETKRDLFSSSSWSWPWKKRKSMLDAAVDRVRDWYGSVVGTNDVQRNLWS